MNQDYRVNLNRFQGINESWMRRKDAVYRKILGYDTESESFSLSSEAVQFTPCLPWFKTLPPPDALPDLICEKQPQRKDLDLNEFINKINGFLKEHPNLPKTHIQKSKLESPNTEQLSENQQGDHYQPVTYPSCSQVGSRRVIVKEGQKQTSETIEQEESYEADTESSSSPSRRTRKRKTIRYYIQLERTNKRRRF